MAYDPNSWSIVHAVYDPLVEYGADGTLRNVLAESLTSPDPLTWEVRLRQGVTFHNGEPFDARSVTAAVARVQGPESQVGDIFGAITAVEEVEPFLVRLRLSAPAPWLPAQMAPWLVMLPPSVGPASDLDAAPVGTGPYVFDGWERGSAIALTANPTPWSSPKGRALAERVRYRFVPEAATRVADLTSGGANLVSAVAVDQLAAIEAAGKRVTAMPIAGTAFVRVPTDVAPFDDVRVRQALNHAVDVEGIIAALLDGQGQRLANLFVPGGLGFDPGLAPYAHDPDRARALLAEAGHEDGFETTLAYAANQREDLVAAVAGGLREVGIDVTLEAVELARFNDQWRDPEAAPLRFVTWRPVFDPFTLLNLVVSDQGFLSRHANPTAQPVLEAAAIEADPATRDARYRELGRMLRDEPAAIYLYSLTAWYGSDDAAAGWTPRADEYVLPLGG